MRYRHHARRPTPINRFVRLGMPDVGRAEPPPYPYAWRVRVAAACFYGLLFAVAAVLLLGLGLVRVP